MREEIALFALGTPASLPSHAAGSRVAPPPPPPIPRAPPPFPRTCALPSDAPPSDPARPSDPGPPRISSSSHGFLAPFGGRSSAREMATSFDRWEKDPFFLAAEEVQESADRMESVYRRWVQERKGGSAPEAAAPAGGWGRGAGELRRELHTALGTAKWQLDELERAVKSNDNAVLAGKDTRARHDDFVSAIGHRILEVENFLKESNTAEGYSPLSWVRLDEGERDELALFLSAGSLHKQDEVVTIPAVGDIEVGNNARRLKKDASVDSSNDSSCSAESSIVLVKEDTTPGHKRAASAYADIGLWSISIPIDGNGIVEQSSVDQHKVHFAKSPNSSVLMNALQSKPRMKYKNGTKKWAGVDQQDVEESLPLTNSQSSQGYGGCLQRTKSCLSTCDEDAYNKKLYGFLGVFRRLIQRSQYQFQYGCPVQLIVLAVVVLLMFIYALRTFW